MDSGVEDTQQGDEGARDRRAIERVKDDGDEERKADR
jgi:hypothetical protein